MPENSNSNSTKIINKINFSEKEREPKSGSIIPQEKLSSEGIIEKLHHVVQDFKYKKSDDDDINDEIDYQAKILPLNVNLEQTSIQHEELSFGPSFLKIGLKPEENNYQIPQQSSAAVIVPFPSRMRSVEDPPLNISNEISNVTNLETKESDENLISSKTSTSNLEDHIRNEVHEEIQKEKSFENTIIEVLGSISEPEVRETLKQDLLDSNYSEKQKEIPESHLSNDEHIDFIAQDHKEITEKENKAKILEKTNKVFGKSF